MVLLFKNLSNIEQLVFATKKSNASLFMFLKQSFTKVNSMFPKDFGSFVFDAFLSKIWYLGGLGLTLISVPL